MVGPKRLWGKKKRFALIGVAVAVLVVVGWLVWPEQPKNPRLRLQLARSEVVDGKSNLLFRIEGSDELEVRIKGFWYVANEKLSSSNGFSPFTNQPRPRLVWGQELLLNAPQYSPNAKGWRLQADVLVFSPEKNNLGKVFRVIKDAWNVSSDSRLSYFSKAKQLWQSKAKVLISEQTLTSDPITNTPPH